MNRVTLARAARLEVEVRKSRFLAQAADHIQRHAQAGNSLHAALHTLLHGDMDQAGVARAIGKATRAATAMKRLAALQLVEG